MSMDGVALNCGLPCSCVTRFHSSSAILASASVALVAASRIFSISGYDLSPGGMLTLISSHIHCPEVEKLKYFPRIAKPFRNETMRPVGCPLAVQFPVSRSHVLNSPTETTSPPTPSISTQSPTLIPLRL